MMLARILKELSGHNADEEEYETDADEEADRRGPSPSGAVPSQRGDAAQPAQQRGDAAHAAAAPGSDSPPEAPAPGSSSPPQPLSARWSKFIGGARHLLDNLIDLGSSDDESVPDQQQQQRGKQPPPGTSTAGYPTVTGPEEEEEEEAPTGLTTPPTPLRVPDGRAQPAPQMSEPSRLMQGRHVAALAAEVPTRYRQCRWELLYSTQRDGISLQTLLRNGLGRAPTVLVVRDMGRAVFGAFCSEAWRQAPRYYGTGETFVFQLAPREAVWHWWWQKMGHTQNDFFMWGEKGAIAVGGAGGYALWLDAELARGLSRSSITFGNDSLASSEEFSVGAVELWWLK